jgi:hypothetical protein
MPASAIRAAAADNIRQTKSPRAGLFPARGFHQKEKMKNMKFRLAFSEKVC